MTQRARTGAVLGVLLVAAAGVAVMLLTAPQQQKESPAPTAPVVDTIPLVPGRRTVAIEAFGTVEPARAVALAPEVEGRVVEIHPRLEPGALLRKGELLVRVDPSDYALAVRRARAALAQAQADLEVERGRGKVAQREWERFGGTLSGLRDEDGAPALALREPQLKQARARVAAAQAALEEAQLNLARTKLEVPFDAFVVRKEVDVGSRVGPATQVVSLAGADTFWITVSMPADVVGRLAAAERGHPVEIRLGGGREGAEVARRGHFVRPLPGLDERGRMARALVAVEDPLKEGAPQIPLGSYVRVTIPAGELDEVYEAPREALRENGQVWVRDAAGTLRYRDADVLWRREATVLLRGDFEEGDELVTSYLSDPLPGTAIRRRDRASDGGAPGDGDGAPPAPPRDAAGASR